NLKGKGNRFEVPMAGDPGSNRIPVRDPSIQYCRQESNNVAQCGGWYGVSHYPTQGTTDVNQDLFMMGKITMKRFAMTGAVLLSSVLSLNVFAAAEATP